MPDILNSAAGYLGISDPGASLRGTFNPGRFDQPMGSLQSLLMQRAQGTGPSVADMQGQANMRALFGQQQSMAAGARPGQSGMANRMAMQNMGNIGGQLAQQTQMARLMEQQQNQNALASFLLGARGQDVQGAIGAAQIPTAGDKLATGLASILPLM